MGNQRLLHTREACGDITILLRLQGSISQSLPVPGFRRCVHSCMRLMYKGQQAEHGSLASLKRCFTRRGLRRHGGERLLLLEHVNLLEQPRVEGDAVRALVVGEVEGHPALGVAVMAEDVRAEVEELRGHRQVADVAVELRKVLAHVVYALPADGAGVRLLSVALVAVLVHDVSALERLNGPRAPEHLLEADRAGPLQHLVQALVLRVQADAGVAAHAVPVVDAEAAAGAADVAVGAVVDVLVRVVVEEVAHVAVVGRERLLRRGVLAFLVGADALDGLQRAADHAEHFLHREAVHHVVAGLVVAEAARDKLVAAGRAQLHLALVMRAAELLRRVLRDAHLLDGEGRVVGALHVLLAVPDEVHGRVDGARDHARRRLDAALALHRPRRLPDRRRAVGAPRARARQVHPARVAHLLQHLRGLERGHAARLEQAHEAHEALVALHFNLFGRRARLLRGLRRAAVHGAADHARERVLRLHPGDELAGAGAGAATLRGDGAARNAIPLPLAAPGGRRRTHGHGRRLGVLLHHLGWRDVAVRLADELRGGRAGRAGVVAEAAGERAAVRGSRAHGDVAVRPRALAVGAVGGVAAGLLVVVIEDEAAVREPALEEGPLGGVAQVLDHVALVLRRQVAHDHAQQHGHHRRGALAHDLPHQRLDLLR
mmetsp:Transcript_39295/g.123032  ORF Transcript_39295/g.123032 Transcript_39295/m.123032 type:complete len:659 (-) Transcript_39295:757-2733(-)